MAWFLNGIKAGQDEMNVVFTRQMPPTQPAPSPSSTRSVPTKENIFQGIHTGGIPCHHARLQWLQSNPKRVQIQCGAIQRSLQLKPGMKGEWSEQADLKLNAWLASAPAGQDALAICDKQASDDDNPASDDDKPAPDDDSTSSSSTSEAEGEDQHKGNEVTSEPCKKKIKLALDNLADVNKALEENWPDDTCIELLQKAQLQLKQVLEA